MKKTITALAAIFALTIAASAFAQDAADTTEYTFDDDIVEGDLLRPDESGIVVLQKDKSKSLVKVRKHYVPEMLKSVENI